MDVKNSRQAVFFPVHTLLGEEAQTICRPLTESVFSAPFFNEGVDYLRDEEAFTARALEATDFYLPELTLKGFIYHNGHCGSTLLAQMLKASPNVRVVSETEAINGLLLYSIFNGMGEDELLTKLRTIVAAYQQKLGDARNLIFKLTSWNIHFISLFQKAFPGVPSVYLDRETKPLLRSLEEGGHGFVQWWEPHNFLLHERLIPQVAAPQSKDDFIIKMIEQQRKLFAAHQTDNDIQLHYPAFLDDFESTLLPHFGLSFSAEELLRAQDERSYDAKSNEKVPFTGTRYR